MVVEGEYSEAMVSNLSIKTRSKLSSSFRLSRSRSSGLFSDWIPFESARFTAYERLSESMRLSDEPERMKTRRSKQQQKKSGAAWGFITKVFSLRMKSGDDGAEKKKVKLRSSWLPDPDRRWPVQGWG